MHRLKIHDKYLHVKYVKGAHSETLNRRELAQGVFNPSLSSNVSNPFAEKIWCNPCALWIPLVQPQTHWVDLSAFVLVISHRFAMSLAIFVMNRTSSGDRSVFPDPDVFDPDRENLDMMLTWNGQLKYLGIGRVDRIGWAVADSWDHVTSRWIYSPNSRQ